MKSEPDSFGYDDLVRNKREGWDGVRNYQARIHLRAMAKGDEVIFYHSNAKPPGVAGICKIVKGAEPDPTQFDPTTKYHDPTSDPDDPRWDWVTVAPERKPAPKGPRRIHKTPSWREVQACRPWLDAELAAVKPTLMARETMVCPMFSSARWGTTKRRWMLE